MRVLVVNSGSSSLKFLLAELSSEESGTGDLALSSRVIGSVMEIGGKARLRITDTRGAERESEREVPDHAGAAQWMFEHLPKFDIEAVGHRIVQGGNRFRQPVRIDAAVLKEIEALSVLAPLHNPVGIAGIQAAKAALGEIPMVAVFDTAFHQTLPSYASTYAIPRELAAKHGIRRFGFHGIAHASLAEACAAALDRPLTDLRLITLHLGNGCSAAAIRFGKSMDTSMGFTPLEGLVMGTRSGDLDPSLVSYLARREREPADTVEEWLNERSGLLGISGLSHDMRTLLTAAEREPHGRAALAIEVFCYRVRKYIGAYLAVLGGADAVIFGGGIGEQAPAIRAQICEGMEWCGLSLDLVRNAAAVGLRPGGAVRISRDTSELEAYVVAADEESWIARETVRYLREAGS